MTINHKNTFRLIIVGQTGSLFLLVLFSNLPKPISLPLFWSILWVLALFILKPHFLFSRIFAPIYLYALVIFIGSITVWQDIDSFSINYLWYELVGLFTAMSMLAHFILTKDYVGLSIVIKFAFICIIITVITSSIGLLNYPMAARDLAGVLARDNEIDLMEHYKSIGIGGYGFFAAITFMLPIFIFELKSKSEFKSKKYLYFLILPLFIFVLFQAKYLANVLLGIGIIIASLLEAGKMTKSIFILAIITCILVILPLSFYINSLVIIANSVTGTFLQERLLDLANYLNFSAYTNTEIARRADRVPVLFENFLKSPLWGGEGGNGHLHWLNKLASFGLIGTIPIIYLLIKYLNSSMNKIIEGQKYYYLISVISFFLLGSVKSLIGDQIFYMTLFIIPGYYLYNRNLNNPQY